MTIQRRPKLNSYLDHLYALDYKERPVDIWTFLEDPTYLGKLTEKGNAVYDVWKRELPKIMSNNDKWQIVLTGAIGIGKTRAAVWGMCYILYRILCLKNPWKYFGRAGGGKMVVVFFNLVKSQSKSKGFRLLHTHLLESPWFMEHGNQFGSKKEPYWDNPLFEFKLASPYAKGYGIQGDDVITGILDEVDAEDESEGQKRKVISAYDSAVNRFTSRFVRDGNSISRLFLVASKQEQLSFLNTFVEQRKNDPSVYIVDVPVWEAHAKSNYCGKKFPVKIGDAYDPSAILTTDEELEHAKRGGFKIIMVPIEFKEDFIRDPIKALRDKAGIAATSMRMSKLFPGEKIITDCYDPEKKDPISKTTIMIGLKDNYDLTKYIDFNAIRTPMDVPRFFHWDCSLTHDATGLACSAVVGWTHVSKTNDYGEINYEKEPVVETDFVLRLKAKPGDEIPFLAIRKLVIDLRKLYGMNISKLTADLRLLSADSLQAIEAAGIPTEKFSMDTNPHEYRGFRDLCAQNRWVFCMNRFLHFELMNLEDDTKKNKIDHPDKVSTLVTLPTGDMEQIVLEGSKDCADAVSGSVMQALKHCEVPPDMEVMQSLMDTINKPAPTSNEYIEDTWWAKTGHKRPEQKASETKDPGVMNNKEQQLFQEILRRAKQ